MQKEESITNLSTLLNSQLRGGINEKAREINLELIRMTMDRLWDEVEYESYKAGVQDTLAEKVKEEIIEKIKKG